MHERVVRIVHEAADALVAEGAARLDEDPPRPAFVGDMVELTPTCVEAAPIAVCGSADLVELYVEGQLHEMLVSDPSWEAQLRACLDAVVAGRYTEEVVPDDRGSRLRMIFESAGEPIVVTHWGGSVYGPARERRFPPYRP